MEEYILHELSPPEGQSAEEIEAPTDNVNEPEHAPDHANVHVPVQLHEADPGSSLEFVPVEEPGPNWEMELAQAYVRAQQLESVFPPEEGLKMGTAFPNLSQPYNGRD